MLKHHAVSFLVEVGMACSLACLTSESDLGGANRDAGRGVAISQLGVSKSSSSDAI